MANFLYTPYKVLLLTGSGPNLSSATIKVMFLDAADDTRSAADDFLNDIASAARVPALGSAPTLGTKTTTGGAFDSADPTFTALTGDVVEELLLFEDSGVESTSDLIANYDTFASGMPLTPNGGDVTVNVHASGWFSL